jgi:hypothetical protein
MYKDPKLRKLMDIYSIVESASSCEFTVTKPLPQSAKMTKFARKKAFGEAITHKKQVKEDVSEEKFLDNMFDKFMRNRGLQEGAVLRAVFHAAMKKRDEKKSPLKAPTPPLKRKSPLFGKI